MRGLKLIVAALGMVALLGFPAVAEEGLPVEIDVELLRAPITLQEAKDRFTNINAPQQGLDKSERQQAIAVLEELSEKGIPVDTAYNAVVAGSEAGADVRELSSAKDADELKEMSARMDVENRAEEEGLKAEDVAVAVEVLDGLVEEGVPVEKARDVVKEAISEDRDPQRLKEMLTDKEAIEEMKGKAERSEREDDEAVQERMKERRDEDIQDRIRDRDIDVPSGPGR